ncbi:Uncharacterised protein [Moraxella caviae]|nr:Uncharacterised protein [Moraxella caviae]
MGNIKRASEHAAARRIAPPKSLDFALELAGVGRFRANIFGKIVVWRQFFATLKKKCQA